MKYVLINDEDVAIWSSVAAELVADIGVKQAAERYGVSEGKLRQFLNANGWVGKRQTSWEKVEPEPEPELAQVPVPPGAEDRPF